MDADGTLGAEVRTDDLAQVTIESWCRQRPYTVGATPAFTRRSMERFGPFLDDLWYEDIVIGLRAILGGGAATVPEPLVHYRRGGSSRWPSTHRGEQLVHWVRTQNRRVLAGIRQHVQDARLGGVEGPVAASLTSADLGLRALPGRDPQCDGRRRALARGPQRAGVAAGLAAAQVPDLHFPRAGGTNQAHEGAAARALKRHADPEPDRLLDQHDVVLLGRAGGLRLQRDRLADEIAERREMLAFLVDQHFDHAGVRQGRGTPSG